MSGPGAGTPSGHPRVTLVSRSGCHLCALAREELARLSGPLGFDWTERWVDDDAELTARYSEYVPVVLVDDRVVGWYRVDEARLSAGLKAAGTAGPAAG